MAAKSPTLNGNEGLAKQLLFQAIHVVVHLARSQAGERRIDSVVVYSEQGAATVIYATDETGQVVRQSFNLAQLPERIRMRLDKNLTEVPEA
jgi:Flp pilus assembly CpaF family ATPase